MNKGNDIITTVISGTVFLGALAIITISILSWIFS